MGIPQSGGPRAAGRPGFAPALLAAGFLLQACSATKDTRADAAGAQAAAEADTARTAVLDRALRRFEAAVMERDTTRFMDLLDGHYRKVEFEGFYRGATPQFLNEFFCGKTPKGDQMFCQIFGDISEFQRTALSGAETEATVEYKVKTPEQVILARLKVNLEKDGQVKGFIGSNGYTQVE